MFQSWQLKQYWNGQIHQELDTFNEKDWATFKGTKRDQWVNGKVPSSKDQNIYVLKITTLLSSNFSLISVWS